MKLKRKEDQNVDASFVPRRVYIIYRGYLASSEPRIPTTASPEYHNTPEKQDSNLKSHLMMPIENFKMGINNSLKEIQENTVEALKAETQRSFKELHENTFKHVEELNKTMRDIKLEIETIKKSQRETTLEKR